MDTHVKVVAILNIVLGALGLLGALAVFLIFGGAAGIIGSAGRGEPDAGVAVGIVALVGTVIFVLILFISLPCLIAGIGLLDYKEWARILTIILSVLNLVNFPLGTAIGAYSLWALLSRDTAQLFAARRAA
jgi:hypothetical protein